MAGKTLAVLLLQSVKVEGTLHGPGATLPLPRPLAKQLIEAGAACAAPTEDVPVESEPEPITENGDTTNNG